MTGVSQAEQRRQLVEFALALNSSGLSVGKSGNLSVRCGDSVLITPTGIAYRDLTADHIVALAMDGEVIGEQAFAPSSEWRFHCDLYRQRPDTGAIVHAHPPASTALACTGRGIPAFHYMVAIAGGMEIPIADYALFGSAGLSHNILSAIGALNACLLANHGLIALGANLEQAFNLAVEVEQLAVQYSQALLLGDVNILSEGEMRQVLQKFKTYGQRH